MHYLLIDCFLRSIGVIVCVFNHKNARNQYHVSLASLWTAQFEYRNKSVSTAIKSNPIHGCGHQHSLVIEFPFTEAPIRALITTSNGWQSGFIPVSNSEPKGNYFLVGYSAITENFFQEEDRNVRYVKQLLVLTKWINYHLNIGFDHIAIYLDLDQPHYEFVFFMQTGLADLVKRDKVSIEVFMNINREYLFYQQAFGMHCLERFRSKAKWFSPFDLDEYYDVRGAKQNLVDVILNVSKSSGNTTIQVVTQFWGSPENVCWSTNITSFTVKKESYIWGAREKCIFNLDYIKYYSVHMPTNPPDKVNPNPDLEVRLNHYKGFGCLEP